MYFYFLFIGGATSAAKCHRDTRQLANLRLRRTKLEERRASISYFFFSFLMLLHLFLDAETFIPRSHRRLPRRIEATNHYAGSTTLRYLFALCRNTQRPTGRRRQRRVAIMYCTRARICRRAKEHRERIDQTGKEQTRSRSS